MEAAFLFIQTCSIVCISTHTYMKAQGMLRIDRKSYKPKVIL